MPEETSSDLRLDLLLVEDNPGDARLIQEQLEEGPLRVRHQRARTLEEALGVLETSTPDVVLLDMDLPDSRGMDTLEALRKGAPDVPVVVLTGTDDDDLAVRSLRRGAQDYLTKGGATPDVLVRSIRYARERKAVLADLERAVEELQGERGRLQEIFQDAPVFIATLKGQDHVFEMANPAYRELAGERELSGRGVREVFPELEEQGFFELLDEVYRTGEPYRAREQPIELERDGRSDRRYLSFVYQPRRRGDEVTGIIALGTDVTLQVEARKDATDRREMLEKILDTTADGVLFAGPDGGYRYANPAAEEILGLEEDVIASRSYRDPGWGISGPDGGPFPEEKLPVARVLRTGEAVHGVEHGIMRPDGSRVVISVNAAPMKIPDTDEPGVVASLRDVTDRREFESRLRHRALHDPLTGLPNRALFQDRLEQALKRGERTAESIGVLILDLDRFKAVNDGLGHEAGDRLLEEVARRLRELVQDQDTVARVGGDEFTVLIERVEGETGLREAAERVLDGLSEPMALDGGEIVMDASLGAALCRGGDASWTDLVGRADNAMYVAKERPGPGLVLASELEADAAAPSAGRSPLEKEVRLRTAVEEDRIDTVYQPILSLADGTVVGVEALARWTDPDLGRVSPLEFIGIAEETGVILSLGDTQLRRACRQGQEWLRAGLVPDSFRIHVNLSARQLEDPAVVIRIQDALRDTELPAENLFLEVTESAAVEERETVVRLKELGLSLSVDDFGTGHSTLAQLRFLPLDEIKIDRSFIRGLPSEKRDLAIVRSVLTLSESLGLTAVAEGIESQGQLAALRELGCTSGQGYLLGRPAPPAAVEEMLRDDDRSSVAG